MSEKAGVFVGLLPVQLGVFVGLLRLSTGGICRFISNDSVYILTIKVKFPTILVLQRALLKKMWIRLKRLKNSPDKGAEKQKTKRTARLLKRERSPQLDF
jgi:hypothetical protein